MLDEQIEYRTGILRELNKEYDNTKDAQLIDKIKLIRFEVELLRKGRKEQNEEQAL